jgi:hypothetical protein
MRFAPDGVTERVPYEISPPYKGDRQAWTCESTRWLCGLIWIVPAPAQSTVSCETGNICFIVAHNFSFKQTLICCAFNDQSECRSRRKSGLHVLPEGHCKPTRILIYTNANKGNIFMSCSSIHAEPGYLSDAVHIIFFTPPIWKPSN